MASLSWFLDEIASIFSNLPIALYALGFRVQDGLVSAICKKAAAPVPFIGAVNDFRTLWDIKETDLFGILGTGKQFQVASLRHGNNFPLVNRAILAAAGCVEQPPAIRTDLSLPRAVNVNVTFMVPKEGGLAESTYVPPKLVGGLIGCLELAGFLCSAILQFLVGMYVGAALAAALAIGTICYLVLHQIETPVYAHQDAIKNDLHRTAMNGAATDVHVIVPDWNSDEMYVLVGYSSVLHALTNIPARVNRPLLLRWTCRALGVVLCCQAALLAKLIQAPPPALYGSPIWLASIMTAYVIRASVNKIIRKPILVTDLIETVRAPQIVLPARRTALAFIASLPITSPKVGKWEWVDNFLPNNSRRAIWQQEMDEAALASANEPKLNLSDDGRRIVSQVRRARFGKELVEVIDRYKMKVGIGEKQNGNTRQ